MTLKEANKRLNLTSEFLPVGASNRPGIRITPTFITVHNTDNPGKGADALAHAKYLKGTDARKRKVSWHYTVDDTRAVKHLPTSEVGWHAGSSDGNHHSIGIEICEDKGSDQDAANERAALLVAVLMQAFSIPIARVVPHQHWSGKHCPHLILEAPGGFAAFRVQCEAFLKDLSSS